MAPSISIREHIRWLPDPASEPTTTLVLTSAENRFVDIRILKPTHSPSTESKREDVLPLSHLDWAFAGTSTSVPQRGEDGKAFAHSTWKHWVSSKTRDVDGVSDEGDMFPLPEGRVLEKGRMSNPATGVVTEYEELWFDPPFRVVEDGKGDGEGERGNCCVVLQLQDDEHEARGVVVRVGQYVQGVLRVGEGFSLERWEWKGKGKDEGWQRLVRMGDLWLPCGPAMDDGRLKEEGEVKYGEYLWKVVELSYF
ncbi:hypothetical protein B0A55_02018 [Friedmanniomyces simplex]|uniref:Protein HRI1 n=1 Tax=Friedmanniomyces simplex TaxID=329884 RepID=A0A4U0XXC0_9PEZI|nr:hypothetical protein B0A55_02018 [Friedmanniomyces simplex]